MIWSNQNTVNLVHLVIASYLDISASLPSRRLEHRRMASGNGFDVLGAEDQPYAPFAWHSPQ